MQEKERQYLETRCDSLERSVQTLMKEQQWEYSAPAISNARFIPGMETFLQGIKNLKFSQTYPGI